MGPIERAYTSILDRLTGFLADNFENVANYVELLVTGIVMILVAWSGYKLFAGRGAGETVSELVVLFAKYAVIIALFSAYSTYDTWIVTMIQETPDSIAGIFPYETTSATGYSTERENVSLRKIDDFLAKTIEVAVDMMSWREIGESLLAILVIIIALLATVFAVLQFGIADIGTILFLTIGPLAITAGLFPQTKGLFEGWIRLLVTFVVLKILIVLVLELMLSAFTGTAIEFEQETINTGGFEGILAFLIFTLLLFMVLLKVPDFSSQMGGAMAVSAAALTAYIGSQAWRAGRGTAGRSAGAAAGAYAGAAAINRSLSPADPSDREAVAARRRSIRRGALAGAVAGAAPGWTYTSDANKRRARMVVAQLQRQEEMRADAARRNPHRKG